MFSPDDITCPRESNAIRMTIVGDAGVGKTTLASYFPSPIILAVEDGTTSLAGRDDVGVYSKIKNHYDVLDAIKWLGTNKHDYKTLIIDSISKLAQIIESHVIDLAREKRDNGTNINTIMGGYGAGQNECSMYHKEIFDYCDHLKNVKNMNIIFISHAKCEHVEEPDCPAYDRWTMDMHHKSSLCYKNDVDIVCFISLKKQIVGDDSNRRVIDNGGAKRELIMHSTASRVSKNRYNIDKPIPFEMGVNPFKNILNIN